MNKKTLFLILGAVLVVLLAGGGVALYLKIRADNAVTDFDVSKYSDITQKYGAIKADYVASAQQAKSIAGAVWSSVYGSTAKIGTPYRVSFDKANKVWLVEGAAAKDGSGIPHILIQQADCKILAVWFDK